jgi:hypothetical protein
MTSNTRIARTSLTPSNSWGVNDSLPYRLHPIGQAAGSTLRKAVTVTSENSPASA